MNGAGAFKPAQAGFTMLRILALAASVLCLAGCFDFNKTFGPPPTATFQIVISSTNYGGTYVWNSQDYAYEAAVGSTQYYVYMDSQGYWCLANQLNQTHLSGSIAFSTNSPWGTLPPTSSWSGSGSIISSIDDSAGGLSMQGGAPDGGVSGGTLQVQFLASSPGNGATYQWQRSTSNLQSSFGSPISIGGNSSTYVLQSGVGNDYQRWIRVIVTPTDSTGTIQGTPVISQPVFWP